LERFYRGRVGHLHVIDGGRTLPESLIALEAMSK